jgi:hypothetical protein
MNISKNGVDKSLADEPGITELMRLYLDDNYDYSNGNFTGMTDSTKSDFMKDLKLFYTAFTGNETMPPEITKFSDIKLRDYNKKPGCQGTTPVLKGKYTLKQKDTLFVDYAENTKKMIQTAADNQSKLLSVINELFTYVIDPYSGKKVIRINPKLNEEFLQKAVEKTRRFIVDLYIKCETDYVTGVKLYEAIVESKILETTQKQIENLKNEAKKIITDTQKSTVPVVQKPAVVIVEPSIIPSTSSSIPSTSSSIPSTSSSIPSTSSSVPSTSSSISSTSSSIPSTSSSISSNMPITVTNSIVSPTSSMPIPPSITGETQLATGSLTPSA